MGLSARIENAVIAEPFLVLAGWERSVFIPNPGGPTYRLLYYPDGQVAFEHRCDRGDRGVVICAPMLRLGAGHSITQEDPVTISPSILCPDCGTHGFIQNGRWTG